MTTAMKDAMEAKDWAPELRVCRQPPKTLPSDTRLHRLFWASQCKSMRPCMPNYVTTITMCP